ncbi:MAG: helix-turn-helix domain-containing protein [Acholeplasmatales bacterium]|nr:helix-turn-helix domain-containing protein [Acholeplasmatales bacterium]
MDLAKIGNFIKELRKEKGDTQDELAEKFFVSRRTVSRWETGANLPDIEVLMDLADYFNVDLREILNGKKKDKKDMNEEIKETIISANDYTKTKFKRTRITTLVLLIIGLIALMFSIAFEYMDYDSFIFGFLKGMMIGLAFGSILVAILYITGVYDKFALKMCRRK